MTHINTVIKTLLLAMTVAMFLTAAHIANAQDTVNIPVLKQHVKAGTIIHENMLDLKTYPARTVRVMEHNKENIIGLEATRNLRAGLPLRPGYFRTPLDVRRGQPVVLKYNKMGIVLSTEGKSLSDGRIGDVIYAINAKSGMRIKGRVEANGLVLIQ